MLGIELENLKGPAKVAFGGVRLGTAWHLNSLLLVLKG